jgi:quercetin dioxygenase-like cupin family protein
MIRFKKTLVLGLIVFLYAPMLMASQIKISPVLRSSQSWNGATLPHFNTDQPEFSVFTYTIPAGAKTAVHIHPFNGAGYMLSGELTLYATDDPHGSFADKSKVKKIKLTAGNAWTEAVNTWHYGENLGKQDVKFVLIFSGKKGIPTTLSLDKANIQ